MATPSSFRAASGCRAVGWGSHFASAMWSIALRRQRQRRLAQRARAITLLTVVLRGEEDGATLVSAS